MQIVVGYAVGSGEPVAVPLRHMAVTGQTQESGKTTTLEAMTRRMEGRTALAFVTKRGESAFADARRVQPYFHDRADWQFVTSLLDATLQEKNKFLRPWIMKICRTTHTLADVQREVRKALLTAKGIHEGVYTQLDAYLDLIVPEIKRARLAPALDIGGPGIAVMDISSFSTPMQMLFVQSAIDWINEYAKDTVVIVPEAWEFIPEGKGSPVKFSAVALVRKGAGVGNYIWVDSQDMAGVDKVILRGCAVWLIGVQREANEIKRNLANIPKGIKRPSAADVAMLERGQFYVCWSSHAVKTYVRPAWMLENAAIAIARGELRTPPAPVRRAPTPPEETIVNEREADELRRANEKLRAENEQLRGRVDELTGRISQAVAAPASNGHAPIDNGSYEALRERLAADLSKMPAVLRVLASKPTIEVEVTRHVITVDGGSVRGRIARLIASGFFEKPRTSGDVLSELEKRGSRPSNIEIGNELKALTEMGYFTRENKWITLVPEMTVNVLER